MKNKAMKKMLKELDVPEYNSVMERIHVYLCNTDDDKLLTGVLHKEKNIKDASMYCYKKGAEIQLKFGGVGVSDVTPEMEIEWIKEYYLKEKIEQNDLMSWPKPGAGKTKEIIKEVEVIKEVFVGTPSMEQMSEYLKQQKEKKIAKKATFDNEENLSLFE